MNIQPDIAFITQVKKLSKSSVKTCMQCGECSVVCSLAPEDKPFPRKEMILTGWGLKDKVLGNPDVWLCHQCGDCSTHCPRNVKPADVLSSLRQISYMHYARPKFLGKLLSEAKYLPLALLMPVVIISIILLAAGTLHMPEGHVNYSKFFPHAWLNSSFTLITWVIVFFTISGIRKFWKDMEKTLSADQQQPETSKKNGFIKTLWQVKKEIILHSNFSKCNTQKSRKTSHFLVFYGFVILLLVTLYAILATFTHNYPLTLMNPAKIAGNIAALMLFIGLGMMMVNRLFNKEKAGNSNYSDWLFLISLFLLTLSGIIVQVARFQNWSLAYHIYFFHLVNVWFVIIYAPYIKFGHFIYRIVAMFFHKKYNRL